MRMSLFETELKLGAKKAEEGDSPPIICSRNLKPSILQKVIYYFLKNTKDTTYNNNNAQNIVERFNKK